MTDAIPEGSRVAPLGSKSGVVLADSWSIIRGRDGAVGTEGRGIGRMVTPVLGVVPDGECGVCDRCDPGRCPCLVWSRVCSMVLRTTVL